MFNNVIQISLAVFLCVMACSANAFAAGNGDPLRPPGYGVSNNATGSSNAVRGWTVNEILFSGGRRVAIVNDTPVVIGDRINGAKVVDIKSAHVVLEYNKKIINARLVSVSVKKQIKTKIN